MSVILTACRNSRQKAIDKAVKKKAAKKKEKKDAASSALSDKLGVRELEGDNNVKIWTFLLNGEPTSVVLHRDSLEVAWNGEVVDSSSDFCQCGVVIDFMVGNRKAQITSNQESKPGDDVTYTLTIEGCLVPDICGINDMEAAI